MAFTGEGTRFFRNVHYHSLKHTASYPTELTQRNNVLRTSIPVCVQLHALRPLLQWIVNRRLGGPQDPFGPFGERK